MWAYGREHCSADGIVTRLKEFYEKKHGHLGELELSYVASRYFDVDYSENVARGGLSQSKNSWRCLGLNERMAKYYELLRKNEDFSGTLK